jgi:chromosome segregation ATPase
MTNSYKKALEDSKRELRALVAQRDEINLRIERAQAAINGLANMLDNPDETVAQLAEMNEIVGPVGLTDAVGRVVQASLDGFTAVEVRDMLEAMKFDLSKYSNALAAIHTTLKRLEGSRKVRSFTTPQGDTRYQWQWKQSIQINVPKVPPPPRFRVDNSGKKK